MVLPLNSFPKLVIFDCDGVLVDSETPMHEELRLELQERGVSLSMEKCLNTFMGKSIEDVIQTAVDLGASLPVNWKSILYERVFARLNQGVDIIPGVIELLQRLKRADIPFCVVSNGSEKKMKLMLSQHGIWDDFKDHCYSAQTIGIAKPDPGLLRYALHSMNAVADQSVIIEDSPVGVQSAMNARVPCLIYDPSGSNEGKARFEKSRFQTMPAIADHIFSLA
ncbi:HAD family phosphatase [uncultured Roseibium sp.]|uniref:HAD family hydrolase n=1 Tax=uncultured Roseibium sp. TaxID=1936171 RepID=UPI00321750CE